MVCLPGYVSYCIAGFKKYNSIIDLASHNYYHAATPVHIHIHAQNIPYSGKFSWVQIFAEMPPDPPEEIFVKCTCSSDHTPTLICTYTTLRYAMNVAWLKFSYFCSYTGQSENRENLYPTKISHYTVLCIIN